MIAPGLAGVWTGVLSHLWQTSVVLLLLFALSRLLRPAPSRVEHTLWTVGLAKLLLPLSLGGALWRTVAPESRAVPNAVEIAGVWFSPGGVLSPVVGRAEAAPWLLAVTIVWIAGAGAGLLKVARDERAAARLAKTARTPTAVERKRLGGVRPEHVRVTEAPIPCAVVGVLRPRIILSERLLAELSANELRGVLEHEEAHRRRRDPARTLARRIVGALFFFFPPLVPLIRRLHETAEYACDESTVRTVPRAVYARALARVTRLGLEAAPSPAFVGAPRESLLRRRFRRIEDPRRYEMSSVHRMVLAVAVTAVALASFSPGSTAGEGTAKEPAFDEAPRPTEMAKPEYPQRARKDGAEGTVILQVVVKADGSVGGVEILENVADYPELGDAGAAAVAAWRFSPATKDGRPVKATVTIPLRFLLDRDAPKAGPEPEPAPRTDDDC